MLAMIAVTILGVVRFRERRLEPRRAIKAGLTGGLTVFFVLFLIFFPNTMHAYERSWMTREVTFMEHIPSIPWRPIILVSVCSALLCGCNPAAVRIKWTVLLLCLFSGWLLGTAYRSEIIQQQNNLYNAQARGLRAYTLCPELAEDVTSGRLQQVRQRLPEELHADDDQVVYPAGWLAATAFWKKMLQDDQQMYLESDPYFSHKGIVTTRAEWHTFLTGFYRVQEVPFAVWYPGGKIKDALGKVE